MLGRSGGGALDLVQRDSRRDVVRPPHDELFERAGGFAPAPVRHPRIRAHLDEQKSGLLLPHGQDEAEPDDGVRMRAVGGECALDEREAGVELPGAKLNLGNRPQKSGSPSASSAVSGSAAATASPRASRQLATIDRHVVASPQHPRAAAASASCRKREMPAAPSSCRRADPRVADDAAVIRLGERMGVCETSWSWRLLLWRP